MGILRGECRSSQLPGGPAHGALAVGFFLLPATGLPICPILGSQSLLPIGPPHPLMVDGWSSKDCNSCFGICSVSGLGVSERLAPLSTTTTANCLSSGVDASLVQVLARWSRTLAECGLSLPTLSPDLVITAGARHQLSDVRDKRRRLVWPGAPDSREWVAKTSSREAGSDGRWDRT